METIEHAAHTKHTSAAQTYYPLILTLILVSGLAVYTTFVRTPFPDMGMVMQDFMGFFFILFAFFKFLDIRGFADNFAKYDLLAMRMREYAYVYPFLELGLGVAYLMLWNIQVTAILTVILMGFGALGVIKAKRDGKNLKCGCMGSVINLPLSTITIVENVGMAAMALMILLI